MAIPTKGTMSTTQAQRNPNHQPTSKLIVGLGALVAAVLIAPSIGAQPGSQTQESSSGPGPDAGRVEPVADTGGVSVLGFAPVAREDQGIAVGIVGLPMRAMDGDGIWTSVVVEIDGPSLLHGEDEPETVEAELIVHAFDADGTVVDTALESLRFTRGDSIDRLRKAGAKIITGMMLDPGTYRIRALVRHAATEREGSAELAVALGDSLPTLIPPMVPETAESWVVVQGHRPEYAGSAPQRPFFVRDQTFLPAVAARTQAGRNLPVVLMGYGLAGAEDEIDAALTGPGGVEIDGLNLMLSPAQASRDGIDRILAVLPLPSALAAGDYRLEVSAFSDSPQATKTVLGFSVGTGSRQPLLAVAMPVPSNDLLATAADAEQEAAPKMKGKEVRAQYRALLTRLASNSRQLLAAELANLEMAGAGGDRETGPSRIENAQMPVIKAIAARDREALVPVLMLHHDTALEHRRQRHSYLMRHSVDMLRRLAELYAPANATIGSRIVAARALSSLGGHFQASGSGLAGSLFEEALRYDPVHPSALLGLAAIPEKRGGPYTDAVRYLERLVRAHPDNREARLRLAINLRRAGTNLETALGDHYARKHLRRLLATPEADWIYVLAVQEMARSLTHEDRAEEAVELLDEAVARVPENQKLKILHAFCLERSGRRTEAQRVLLAVEPDRTGLDPARGRYNRWPRQALNADRRLFEEGAARRRELLMNIAQADIRGDER